MEEFMKYMANHEKKLKIAFNRLDKNNDGMLMLLKECLQFFIFHCHKSENTLLIGQIEPSEIQATMAQLGVHVDEQEARSLLQK